jgi:hypothetical protein
LYASIFELYVGSVFPVDNLGESVMAVPFLLGYVTKVKAPFICDPMPTPIQSYSAGAESLNHRSLVSATAVSERVRLAAGEAYMKVDAF